MTSPTGAAIRDILRVLKRRFAERARADLSGESAGRWRGAEIAAALRYFNRAKVADVLIVARGGGSLEDLWAFNEEIVARAIAACEIPVITGVGHETDFTIADFVADLRAPTPSAAAEIVVRSRQEFERQIAEHQRHLLSRCAICFPQRRHRVRDLQTHRGFRQLEVLVRTAPSAGRRTFLGAGHQLLRLRLASARQRLARTGTRRSRPSICAARGGMLRRRVEQQQRRACGRRSIAR